MIAAAAARAGHKQQGIALVIVLWLLVLLTVIAASHARVVRTEARLASNQLEAGKARNLAEAGARHAILELMVRDSSLRWPADGTIHRVRFEDGIAQIALRDVRGLVDINVAPATLLDTVLAGAGAEDGPRQALVDAILDYRDKDNLKHAQGAEDDDYRRAGLKWAARDDRFSSVEEFRYVLGMTNTLFDRLAPYLTVHSGSPNVMPEFAPPWLLGVLSASENAPAAGAASRLAATSVCQITVWAISNGGSNASLDLVVRLTPTGEKPYSVLSWRAPARSIPRSSG